MKSEHWAIVGGGILGMTLALRLAQRNQRITLFEAGNHLGGLADAIQIGPVTWDRHYHVTLLSDTHIRALLAELKLEDAVRWTETKTGFYTNGTLYSMSNTLEFLKFPPLRWYDRLRLGATIFYASKIRNWRRLEQIPVAQWLLRWSGRRIFDKIWLPLLQAKLGPTYQATSAAFIWATIARLYTARRTGLKKEMFGYVSGGGYRRIIERLTHALIDSGVTLRLGTPLRTITTNSSGIAATTDSGTEFLDRAVLTVPSPILAELCPQLTAAEKNRLRAIRYLGVLCVSLILEQPLAGYYVTNITDPGYPFTAVIEMTVLVDRNEFGGRTLVYLPKYLPSDSPAFQRTDNEILVEFLAGLRRMHPTLNQNQIIAAQVSRAFNVMAIPTLGYSDRIPSMTTSLPGISIVNSSQIVNATLNVNETVRQAEAAVPNLLSESK